MSDNAHAVENAQAVETNLAGFLRTAFTEVCFGAEDLHPLEPTVAKYFHPDYRQWTDGGVVRYPDLVSQMRALRQRVAHGRIEILQCLRDGRQVAARYTVHHIRTDGSGVHGEVFFFGELAEDHRFVRVHELSGPAPDTG